MTDKPFNSASTRFTTRSRLDATIAVFRRNLKVLSRERQLLVAVIVLPIVILLLTSIVFGNGGDQWPVAVIDESESEESAMFIQSIEESESRITPYFTVVETEDLEGARADVRSGRLHMLIVIPSDFETSRTVHVETYNVNTDAMKNAELRLEHAALSYHERTGSLDVVSNVSPAVPAITVWRSAFFSGSAVLLALFFGATFTAANLFTLEIERRTESEILLSPLGATTAGVGIVFTAVFVSWLTSLPTLAVAVLFFEFAVPLDRLAFVYVALIPIQVGCAGLGILLGHLFRQYRVVQPVIIISAIATYFAGGGFTGVNTLPPIVRSLASIWVFSRIFEWFNPVLHGFSTGFTPVQYTAMMLAGVLGLVLCWITYKREEQVAIG